MSNSRKVNQSFCHKQGFWVETFKMNFRPSLLRRQEGEERRFYSQLNFLSLPPQACMGPRPGMRRRLSDAQGNLKSINQMKTLKLTADRREVFGKKGSKAVRNAGQIPAILYGGGETIHFSLDEKSLKPLIYSPNSYIVEFEMEGKVERGVMREVQFHPVKEKALHIDFFRVTDGKPVSIEVPVRLTGNAEGVKQGGKLQLNKRKIRVSGLVENLLDELVVDVTELGLGKTIFVGDLKFNNLTLLTPATTAVASVRITRAARGAADAAANA